MESAPTQCRPIQCRTPERKNRPQPFPAKKRASGRWQRCARDRCFISFRFILCFYPHRSAVPCHPSLAAAPSVALSRSKASSYFHRRRRRRHRTVPLPLFSLAGRPRDDMVTGGGTGGGLVLVGDDCSINSNGIANGGASEAKRLKRRDNAAASATVKGRRGRAGGGVGVGGGSEESETVSGRSSCGSNRVNRLMTLQDFVSLELLVVCPPCLVASLCHTWLLLGFCLAFASLCFAFASLCLTIWLHTGSSVESLLALQHAA